MANTNRDSDLSAPLNDGNYSENAFLTSNAAPQDDTNFPAANPPPKSDHSRTASDGTNVTSALNQPLNIVVLGASFAGLSVGHAFLDTTLAQLRTTSTAPNYRLILVSPSTHIYWNIGAPRALVALGLIEQDDLFIPIEPGYQRHKGLPYTIIQGRAVTWDNSARTIEIELLSSAAKKRYSQLSTTSGAQKRASNDPLSDAPRTQTIPYHALILATGSSAHSNLLSLHGPHTDTVAALTSIHSKLAAAKSIIVCGGGTSGIETAGQLATYLNYTHPPPQTLPQENHPHNRLHPLLTNVSPQTIQKSRAKTAIPRRRRPPQRTRHLGQRRLRSHGSGQNRARRQHLADRRCLHPMHRRLA